jgi:TRAP-type C4-dicarboxylate transport system permease small subunit
VAVNLGSGAFLLVVFAWSFVVIVESWALPLPASDLPTALFMLPVPVGAALMVRHVVGELRRDLARRD